MAMSFRPYFEGENRVLSESINSSTIRNFRFRTMYQLHQRKIRQEHKERRQRSERILEIIHTDICGLFPATTVDGYDFFIIFTDDYSRYAYIYPIKERSEALDKFKILKAEVENQYDLKIKIVRSDCGGEYYGRHTPYSQVSGPFARFL